ncbi:MAG: polysaccharide deacetylase family protein [Gallionellaceae bacterium]|nr:polysaccharide deacetylase family protein [Gallionellaceae bacterium]
MNVARIPVLMYHRVGAVRSRREARYAITPARFAEHMRALARAGHRAVTIDAFMAWLEGEAALPEGSFLLTFDDGFRGVREHALPILEQLHWPFTVFLVSDLIGKEDAWIKAANPARASYPLLNAEEIRDMQQRGCSFHSHTRGHADLPTLNNAELADQLAVSRQALGELLEREVDYLAYPYGHFDERVEAAARAAGYRAAFSTHSGFNRPDIERFRIRRLDVYGSDTSARLLRKIRLGGNDGRLSTLIRYYLRETASRMTGRT